MEYHFTESLPTIKGIEIMCCEASNPKEAAKRFGFVGFSEDYGEIGLSHWEKCDPTTYL